MKNENTVPDITERKGGTIRKTWHHEFGGYVFQPEHPAIERFVEPYVREKEAAAFLDGVAAALRSLESDQPDMRITVDITGRGNDDLCGLDDDELAAWALVEAHVLVRRHGECSSAKLRDLNGNAVGSVKVRTYD